MGESKLIIKCAWCGKDMGEKDGKGQTGISHGICEACLAKTLPDVTYVWLPDGEYMLRETLLIFKRDYPETYHLLITQGVSAVGI